MRIGILCNNRIALPAMNQLLHAGLVTGVGIPANAKEIHHLTQQQCNYNNLAVKQFTRKDFSTHLENWLAEIRPDVVLVKTFPYLIPAHCIDLPRYGFINFHYAPLPGWRGSNPLFWMIRNRATTGAVTVHQMNESFDEGPVLLEQPVPLLPDVNAGLYTTQLAYAGMQLTLQLLQSLTNGTLTRREQDSGSAKWWSRPSIPDLFINWSTMEAEEIRALVNACNPGLKGAVVKWKGWLFGLTDITILSVKHEGRKPGTILSISETEGLTIACRDHRVIRAEVICCEEGYYAGHRLSRFGLKKDELLDNPDPARGS
jgi:methionyl-tRNA formyltransferase